MLLNLDFLFYCADFWRHAVDIFGCGQPTSYSVPLRLSGPKRTLKSFLKSQEVPTKVKHIGLAGVIYASFALQGSVAPGILGSFSPHFLLCALVVTTLSMDHWSVIVWAAAIGLLSDCLRPHLLGVDMLIAALIALSVQLTGIVNRRRLGVATMAFLSLTIPLAALLASAAARAVVLHASADLSEILTATVRAAVATAACSISLLLCGSVAARLLFGFGSTQRSIASNRWSAIH